MIDSVLIANRGEIACRIIRTCRRLGIRSVAVFSEADASARHVRLADASYCIGAAEASRSYLRADRIIEGALRHGVEAIHPGYGFLSEKIELAELCEKEGIVWIGPAARCIAAMGSKIESKLIAQKAGVHGVPGYHGADQSPGRLLKEAKRIGFPILIKASAGGGGKGMRRVDDPADFVSSLEIVVREAKAAFGDDRVLLEKHILRPRHLEVQLAGDKHGNIVHLFERECSIQRNFQKLVEEAPAANLDPRTRDTILDAAVRLGKAVAYDSLGTVEFILDADDSESYFLEMNTRLQVEHPVTEMITGMDLVELQLRVAAGEKLPFNQSDVKVAGWAIEARVNAESPSMNYRPSIGRITSYEEPEGEGLRVDSGVDPGSEVTPYYDSMLLKVIAHAPDRQIASRRLSAALDRLLVLGVETNQMFLRDIIRSPSFHNDVLTTQFIANTFPEGWISPEPDQHLYAAAAAALVLESRGSASNGAGANPWMRLAGFRVMARSGCVGKTRARVRALVGAPVTVDTIAGRDLVFEMNDRPCPHLSIAPIKGERRLVVRRGGVTSQIDYAIDGDQVALFERGQGAHHLKATPILDSMAGAAADAASSEGADIVAPMPGLITAIMATVGQSVRKGDPVVVMEAMKLVMQLMAPQDCVVREIHCAVGQTVKGGTRLVYLEAPAAEAVTTAASA